MNTWLADHRPAKLHILLIKEIILPWTLYI